MYYALPKLAQYALSITEHAAIDTYAQLGLGDAHEADRLATESMRHYLNKLPISARVVIGEGERDEAPMLYRGEELGIGGEEVDIAVDPLEGTNLLANNLPGAVAVIAFSKQGGLLSAPDVYMEKLAIGFPFNERIIDLDYPIGANLKNIAQAKRCAVSDLRVTILSRPRHEELIAKTKEAGASVYLIQDGDVMAIVNLTTQFNLADAYVGIGGAPEGVIAATALQNAGGQICTKLIAYKTFEQEKLARAGFIDLSKQYFLDDLASKDCIFSVTAITKNNILRNLQLIDNVYYTNSLVMYNNKSMVIDSKHKI